VRIVDLDEAGVLQIVGIHDSAIVLVVLCAQQPVDLLDEGQDPLGARSLVGRRLAYRVDVPSRIRPPAQPFPQGIQLVPAQRRGEAAAKRLEEWLLL